MTGELKFSRGERGTGFCIYIYIFFLITVELYLKKHLVSERRGYTLKYFLNSEPKVFVSEMLTRNKVSERDIQKSMSSLDEALQARLIGRNFYFSRIIDVATFTPRNHRTLTSSAP